MLTACTSCTVRPSNRAPTCQMAIFPSSRRFSPSPSAKAKPPLCFRCTWQDIKPHWTGPADLLLILCRQCALGVPASLLHSSHTHDQLHQLTTGLTLTCHSPLSVTPASHAPHNPFQLRAKDAHLCLQIAAGKIWGPLFLPRILMSASKCGV